MPCTDHERRLEEERRTWLCITISKTPATEARRNWSTSGTSRTKPARDCDDTLRTAVLPTNRLLPSSLRHTRATIFKRRAQDHSAFAAAATR